MGAKLQNRDIDVVKTTAAAIQKAAEQLVATASAMEAVGMETIRLPWSERQFVAIGLIVDLCEAAAILHPSQVLAHKQNRETPQEKTMKRSERDRQKRLAKKLEEGKPIIQPGRPRKKSNAG